MKSKSFLIVGDSVRKDLGLEIDTKLNAFLESKDNGVETVEDVKINVDMGQGGYGTAIVTVLYTPKSSKR